MAISKEQLVNPGIEFRPEVRWWLAEGYHTDQTLKNDIQMLYESGFGAVEFLAMDDEGVDSSKYGWGSEEWIHDSQLIVEETTKRNMGVSTTSGTNWANANLTTINPDDKAAAKELDFTSITLQPGQTWEGVLPKCEINIPGVEKQELVAVIAGRREGLREKTVILDERCLQVLTEQVENGSIHFTAPMDGTYELFFFWMHGTGQRAEPSVSVSYTVNYFDKYGVEALIDYWDREVLTEQMREYISQNDRVMMYMDSLELGTKGKGGLFWGYHIREEFQRRRGYDVVSYLPFLMKYSTGMGIDMMPAVYRYDMADEKKIWKIRNDVFQTFTDLYMENMLHPLQSWLHDNGMQLRAEISYGMPFEISQPGKYVDGVETESLEFASQIDSHRGLAGTAHMYQHLFSCETGACLYNYMMGLEFYTQMIYTQFAAGVSKTVLHGYSSIAGSPDATYWPGHEGMIPVFSERFGSRQPAYVHYRDWTDMIARYQMILREGQPRMDIGIIRLDYYYNNMFMQYGPEKETYEKKFMRANEGIYWKDMSLQNAGYTYEYLAPQILEEDMVNFKNGMLNQKGPGYQALILYQEGLPLSAAEKLLELARSGLPVVLVDGVKETIHVGRQKHHRKAASMTTFHDGNDQALVAVIEKLEELNNVRRVPKEEGTKSALEGLGIYPRAAFMEPNWRILTAYRETEQVDYVYLYHYMYTEKAPFTFKVSVNACGKPYEIHCWDGKMEAIARYEQREGKTILELTLMPGEATIIAVDKSSRDINYVTLSNDKAVKVINGSIYIRADISSQYDIELCDGRKVNEQLSVPDDIPLCDWSLKVEDWNEGDKVTIIENRGLGLVTEEVYYETEKKMIDAGKTELLPWKDIPAIGPQVSGIGYYTTEATLPENWSEDYRGILEIGSTNGNTAAVFVNGQRISGLDFNRLSLDISCFLKPGKNEICVEVSSTLTNRLIERNYFEEKVYSMSPPRSDEDELNQEENDGTELPRAEVEPYGMLGPVCLKTYFLKKICEERVENK